MTDDLGNLGIDLAELGIPAGSAVAATVGLNWLAGPSLKAVGRVFGEWTDLRVRNLLRLGEKIEARSHGASSEQLDAEGAVPPRLLYRVLEDGSWIDDDVAQEYLTGILIDSRTASDNEDGVFLARMVSDLTSTQIRIHFALYAALALHAPTISVGVSEVALSNAVWARIEDFKRIIGEGRALDNALVFACLALERAGLVNVVAIGDPSRPQFTEMFDRRPNQPVLVIVPTVLGAELYERAHAGQSRDDPTMLGPTLPQSWVSPSHVVPEAL